MSLIDTNPGEVKPSGHTKIGIIEPQSFMNTLTIIWCPLNTRDAALPFGRSYRRSYC